MASETHAAETLADHIREQTAEHGVRRILWLACVGRTF